MSQQRIRVLLMALAGVPTDGSTAHDWGKNSTALAVAALKGVVFMLGLRHGWGCHAQFTALVVGLYLPLYSKDCDIFRALPF